MHLSALTLKGFKSFASATTLRLEPGITCVVGPNGSGKSNVVDAMSWVLGEHSAKSLRGGAMSDVIFAGTAGRAPLGRAEVTLTIDNHDGALPIEHAEVSVSRLLYRSGESEYAINGTPCRLLDVQELLSDSGIGRELHVIVGQGQLDAVLHARPEDRRAFIEEAAGVLKHRKRKEKALRKLDAMQANLTRLTDLTSELRRQLGPLGRQAEIARKAHVIAATQRDARLRLLADDLVQAREALAADVRDEEAVRRRQAEAEAAHVAAQAEETRLEAAVAGDAPLVTQAQESWFKISSVEERLRGLHTLAADRARLLAEPLAGPAPDAPEPDALEAEAAQAREQEAAVDASLAADRAALAAVTARRVTLETELAAEEKALVAAARAVADRREGMARLAGEVAAARSRSTAADEEIGRLSESLAAARARAARAQADLDALVAEVGVLDDGELGLDEHYEAAAEQLAAAEGRVAALEAEERETERERSSWLARRDALALSLSTKDGVGALLDGAAPGVLGRVATLLQVAPGHEAAVASALGAVADAVAVAGLDGAYAALGKLKDSDGGRAGMLIAGPDAAVPAAAAPPVGTWALDAVTVPGQLRGPVARALAGVVLVPDLDAARAVVAADPQLRAVTPTGELIGRDWVVGGSPDAPSRLEVQAHHDEAAERFDDAVHQGERLKFSLAAAREEAAAAEAVVAEATEALNDNDARIAAFQERLGLLGAQARGAHGEAERLERGRREAADAREDALRSLADLEERQAMAEAGADVTEREPDERNRLAQACEQVRAEEVEARLAVRTGEERATALSGRAAGLLRRAETERTARERLAVARIARERGASVAVAVADVAAQALAGAVEARDEAAAARVAAESARTVREGELLEVRGRARAAAAELDALRDVLHRDEVSRTEQRLRVEQLEERTAEEWHVPLEELIGSYGPDQPIPGEPDPENPDAVVESVPYDRDAQQRRAAQADRQLALLGKVNPLALEEFQALQERHTFLADQLEDLRTTRKDLLGIVRDVDERIHEVFREAFEDTAREFQTVFATLFPGGEGRLVLTDPDDLLITGVEVEARPPGKKVKRLSLLSGGERSLTAIALLLAIFRARPSPFYVLDEVEAALDDVNLGRLLEALEGLRAKSQLIIITHQQRTMETADALYGVTMRGDGVSQVISQRLREREPASV